MLKLNKVDEFRREAGNALFTKQQAMAITLQLLKREADEADEKAKAVLLKAIDKINIRYLDDTSTETDVLLDTFNVARLNSADILNAINMIIFECE